MSRSLPSFLSPYDSATPQTSPRASLAHQHARFTRKNGLGDTHVLWWQPQSGDVKTLLFFIPGNPGLVDFYIPFLSAVYAGQESPDFAIIAQAHLDHFPGIRNAGRARYTAGESLAVQVQSALELLDAVIAWSEQKMRVILVGHSVGSWISLKVLKSRPQVVDAVFLLFPTISHIGDTPNGRTLYPIFFPLPRWIISNLSRLAKILPTRVLSLLYSTWPQEQLAVLRDFISSPTAVAASLSMAHEEMKTIRDLDLPLLEQHRDKLFFYYAEHDGWVGQEKAHVLTAMRNISPSDADWEMRTVAHGASDVPHAFCISHSDPVAKQCCFWLYALNNATGE